MPQTTLTEVIRSLVSQTFSRLRMEGEGETRETILIRGGNYCGRRFETDGGFAVWFVEEGQIKFYGPDGAVVSVIDAQAASPAPLQRAA